MLCCCSSLQCVRYTFAHFQATTHLALDIMSFKLLGPKRTNTEEENKSKQLGTTPGHHNASPAQKKSKATPGCERLDVCIFKVTDQAGNCWRRFEGTVVPLWQVPLQ